MFEQVLPRSAKKILASLGKIKTIKKFYLAGGTALALQLGHRKSIDLDFFSQKQFYPEPLIVLLSKKLTFKVKSKDLGFVRGKINGMLTSFFWDQHPLLRPTKSFLGISVADILDIALMKLMAIYDRGTKRDFIDLYVICQQVSIDDLLPLLKKKYVTYEIYHLVRSLGYFEDAEKQEMPKMFWDIKWQEIKKYFEKEVKKLAKKYL